MTGLRIWLFEDEHQFLLDATNVVRDAARKTLQKISWRRSRRLRWPPRFDDDASNQHLETPQIVILDLFEAGQPAGIRIYDEIRGMPGGDRVLVILWSITIADARAEKKFGNNPDRWLVRCSQKTIGELRAKLDACIRRLDEDASA